MTVLVDLGDRIAQPVISLLRFDQGAVLCQSLRRGEQLLNLAVRVLQSCAHLLTSLGPVRRSLLDLLLKLLEHLPHLLLHDVRHVQINASSDGLQQLIGFGDVVSQPAQIQILCADQLILALRHVHPSILLAFSAPFGSLVSLYESTQFSFKARKKLDNQEFIWYCINVMIQ